MGTEFIREMGSTGARLEKMHGKMVCKTMRTPAHGTPGERKGKVRKGKGTYNQQLGTTPETERGVMQVNWSSQHTVGSLKQGT